MVVDYTQQEWPVGRWPNFSRKEMECQETGECLLCEDMMDALQQIRHELGSPMTISSGYRSPRHSIEAVDVACDVAYAYQVLSAAFRAGFTGIGIKQTGVSRFIHLDYIRPGDGFHVLRPVIWSY